LIITGVTILGKLISTSIGSLLSGQPLKTSVHAGMSLAQIGEFSFIIASLGLTLHVTSHFLYPIAVAVSAITTFTTPYLIRFADPLYSFLEKKLPSRWLSDLDRYATHTQEVIALSNWKILLKAYVYNLIVHSVILIAIIFLSNRYLHPFVLKLLPDSHANLVTLSLALVCMLPFLWAISFRKIEGKAYLNLRVSKKYNRGLLIALELFRAGIAVFYIGFLSHIFLDSWLMVGISSVGVVLIVLILSGPLEAIYKRIEKRFFMNLNERETRSPSSSILPWDAHILHLGISVESPLVGKTLAELDIRRQYGVNIALIERGKHIIATPGRDERLYPHDKLSIIGTDEQLIRIKQLIEASGNEDDDDSTQTPIQNLRLHKLHITSHSVMCNTSVRSLGIRDQTQALIVGVERKGQRILNPGSSFVFELEDIVWIVGNSRRIKTFLQHHRQEDEK
jgi:CPA2 family monovalent cation:H+ antiporter-2